MLANKRHIYIVDDDESVRSALKRLLIAYEFQVETFNSAEEFLNAVPANNHGFLILDIHMPGLDGWETLQRLYASGSQRPVIIVSADKNGGLRERALKTGALGFFQKPINVHELLNLIHQAFQIKEPLTFNSGNRRTSQHKNNERRKDDMKRNFLFILTALFLTTSVLGCNMFKGAGKDLENAGESIQKTVDKND